MVISDYLGSARVTLSTTAEPLQSTSYHPYGTDRTSTGSSARTSYIGREHDNETDLGFGACPERKRGRVRLYEPEYGRFLSTDPLWGEFPQTATYVYADNEPITKRDPSGAIWETIWDVANVVVDGVRVAYHLVKGNKEEAKGAAADLAADGLATLVPGLPAGLTKLRHADEVVDAAKTADKVVDASKAGKKGADGAEQVGKGGASREPKSLPDQMALDQAKKGGKEPGRKELKFELNDSRFKGMQKFTYVLKPKYGKKIEIHYVEDTKTGQRMDFKFKQHYSATSKPKD